MAVFRIEKTRDYTVMSNYHLRDMIRTLTVLLTVMLCMTAFSTVAFASGGDTAPTSEAQTEQILAH